MNCRRSGTGDRNEGAPRSEPNGRCQVCRHADRATIELSLVRGVGSRSLAKRFNLGGKDCISRHRAQRYARPTT